MSTPSSLRPIGDYRPGDHLCCVFDSDEEHLALIAPYMSQGLEKNEKVIYIADERAFETIISYLRHEGVDAESALRNGQLILLTYHDAYMRGGCFEPDAMIALLENETKKALEEGYHALRATGEMTWALRGFPGSDRLMEYEAKLNHFLPGSRALAFCQYDRRRFGPSVILDMLCTHPLAVVDKELHDNIHYISPDDFLSTEKHSTDLKYRLRNLRIHRQEQEKLQQYRLHLEELVRARTEELERANRELEEASAYNRSLIDTSLDPLVTIGPDGRITDVNTATEKAVGFSRQELIGTDFSDYFTDAGKARSGCAQVFRDGQVRDYELELRHRDGCLVPVLYNATVYRDQAGEVIGAFAAARDFTERRKAEEIIEDSLREKEVLIKEIHHRVKNSLNIVASLLGLQAARFREPLLKEALQESQNRVRSIALIHEKLYQSHNLSSLNFGSYIHGIVSEVFKTYGKKQITFTITSSPLCLTADIAIPLALIVNELITNSFKYAFPGERPGSLLIKVAAGDEGTVIVTVQDNGIGFPEHLNFRESSTLGLELVNILTRQIRGTLDMSRDNGTTFTIRFRINNHHYR